MLHFVLLPEDKISIDWPATIEASGPIASLILLGVIAPATTIYAGRAAKLPPTLTAAAVCLELVIASIVGYSALRPGCSHQLQ